MVDTQAVVDSPAGEGKPEVVDNPAGEGRAAEVEPAVGRPVLVGAAEGGRPVQVGAVEGGRPVQGGYQLSQVEGNLEGDTPQSH